METEHCLSTENITKFRIMSEEQEKKTYEKKYQKNATQISTIVKLLLFMYLFSI